MHFRIMGSLAGWGAVVAIAAVLLGGCAQSCPTAGPMVQHGAPMGYVAGQSACTLSNLPSSNCCLLGGVWNEATTECLFSVVHTR